MEKTCPHCGVRQPSTGDAFCCECREPLDEAPAQPEAGPSGQPAELDFLRKMEESARSKKVLGGMFFVGGTFVTAFSFLAASGGGLYFVTWGAIVYGAFDFLRGVQLEREARELRKRQESSS